MLFLCYIILLFHMNYFKLEKNQNMAHLIKDEDEKVKKIDKYINYLF
jgi:hypothetical protein